MIPALRKQFNENFTKKKYEVYMAELEALHPGALDFRNAETPVFIPRAFKDKMLNTCENIIDVIVDPKFLAMTDRGIPDNVKVPGEDSHAQFVVFDFGICENQSGELEPQLIEMQGFPTLFAFQAFHSEITARYANLPEGYSSYLNGYDKESYIADLQDIIVGGLDPEHVILLEIFPEQQKTRIDFYCTQQLLGINIVCLTKLIAEGDKLYYDNNGQKTLIKPI